MQQINIEWSLLKPPSPQEEILFFEPANKSQLLVALGGYRSGKTMLHAQKMLAMSIANQGTLGLEVSPSYPMLRDVLLPAWRELLTRCGFNWDNIYSKGDRTIHLPWSTIIFRSAETSLVGITAGYGGADEDIGLDQFKQLIVRVSDPKAKQMAILLTTTPDTPWLDEMLGLYPDSKVWNMSMEHNYLLDPSVLESYRRMYAGAEAECYISGKLVKLTGEVFHSFREAPHPEGNLTDCELNYQAPYFVGIDFGGQYPAIGYYQEHNGYLDLCDEFAPQRGSGWKIFDIENELQRHGSRPFVCYVDPAGDSANTQTWLSDAVYLKERGFNIIYTTNPMLRSIPFGIQLLNGLFCNSLGERRLRINPTKCPIHLRDIKASVYPSDSRAGRKVLDAPIKDGKHDHTRDAMRYMAINRFGKDWIKARKLFGAEVLSE